MLCRTFWNFIDDVARLNCRDYMVQHLNVYFDKNVRMHIYFSNIIKLFEQSLSLLEVY